MFKKIYLIAILASFVFGSSSFEIATKNFMQNPLSKDINALYEKSCKEENSAVGCYMAADGKIKDIYQEKSIEKRRAISKIAFELYEKSCDMGDMKGCMLLGEFYDESGSAEYIEYMDIKADSQKAMEFYEKACAGKIRSACYRIGELHDNSANFEKAFGYYKLACDYKDKNGCYNAANMYEHGEGVAKNAKAAAEFYGLSCDYGEEEACDKFKKNSK